MLKKPYYSVKEANAKVPTPLQVQNIEYDYYLM